MKRALQGRYLKVATAGESFKAFARTGNCPSFSRVQEPLLLRLSAAESSAFFVLGDFRLHCVPYSLP